MAEPRVIVFFVKRTLLGRRRPGWVQLGLDVALTSPAVLLALQAEMDRREGGTHTITGWQRLEQPDPDPLAQVWPPRPRSGS